MPSNKVMTGARAIIRVAGNIVGIFDSCSWSVNIGAEPIYILGRYNAAEITQTSYEPVTVNCSGFRVIGHGGHKFSKVPKLEDLLTLDKVQITIKDRASTNDKDLPILTVDDCIAISYATGVNAKATSRIQITYLGTKASDESGIQVETSTAAILAPEPSATTTPGG